MKKDQVIHALIPSSVLKGNYWWTRRFQQNQFLGKANQHERPGPR